MFSGVGVGLRCVHCVGVCVLGDLYYCDISVGDLYVRRLGVDSVDGDVSLFGHVDALPALGGLVGGDLGGPLLGHADNPLPEFCACGLCCW